MEVGQGSLLQEPHSLNKAIEDSAAAKLVKPLIVSHSEQSPVINNYEVLSPTTAPDSGILATVNSLLKDIGEVVNAGKGQATFDKERGLSLSEGKENFSQIFAMLSEVGKFLEGVNKLSQKGELGLTNLEPNVIAQHVGTISQQYLFSELATESKDYIFAQLNRLETQPAVRNAVRSVVGDFLDGLGKVPDAVGKLGKVGPSASKALGALGAIYSAYDLINNWGKTGPVESGISGAAVGAYVGSFIVPGAGTVVGGLIGGALGAVSSLFASKKHPHQVARDHLRESLKKYDIINEKYQLKLANGGLYDISKDGGHRYLNVDGSKRAPYEVDSSNPTSHMAIGWAQPLAAALVGENKKLKTDLIGYFVNAAQSNASDLSEVKANMRSILGEIALNKEEISGNLVNLSQQGHLSKNELAAYLHGLIDLLDR